MAKVRKRTWTNSKGEQTAWIADYFDQAGKRHIQTFKTQRDAKKKLVTIEGEVARGVHTPENASITVAEAAKIWLGRPISRTTGEPLEKSTLKQYRNHFDRYIDPRFGAVKLSRLTKRDVTDFVDDTIRAGTTPVMARKVLVSLKALLAEAQFRDLVARNVAASVTLGDGGRLKGNLKTGVDIPSKEEINIILEKVEGRWRPLFIAAVFTGMRSSELRGLVWDDVYFENKTIHVRQRADAWGVMGAPKSAAGDRTIPMSPMVFNMLREWKLACPKGDLGLVFPNGVGKIESHSNIVSRGWYALQIGAGITDRGGAKYKMHALRHFFASWVIEQGFSPKHVQALVGHASIQMTFDRHGHLFPTPKDDQAKFAAGELALVGR